MSLKDKMKENFGKDFYSLKKFVVNNNKKIALEKSIKAETLKLTKAKIFEKTMANLKRISTETALITFTKGNMNSAELMSKIKANKDYIKKLNASTIEDSKELLRIDKRDTELVKVLLNQDYPIEQYKNVYIGIKFDGYLTTGILYDSKDDVIIREVLMLHESDNDCENHNKLMFGKLLGKINEYYAFKFHREKMLKLITDFMKK